MEKYNKQISYKFVGIKSNENGYVCNIKYPEYALKMYKGKR